MAKARILIVDDEEGMLEVCADTLSNLPEVELVMESQSRRAAERLAAESFDLLITDVRMPGLSGVELLRLARQHNPDICVLVITAYPTVESAVESMKLGATDYIVKPFLPDDLRATVRRLLESERLREENTLLRRQVERSYTSGQLLGRSAALLKVREIVDKVAGTDVDVLIFGETGTGKDLVARSIHELSPRKEQPFVPVDCGAIPEELMESEFFGHERGAFTGAHTRNLGLLEFANNGTFFLDEIGQLPLRLQAKLLRALQERRIRRVGGTKEISLNVRIVAATALNLEAEVSKGRFRLDLYHRIHVVRIELPPLRERGADIALLARHFVTRYAEEMKRGPVEISPEALEVLAGYAWPGNVRELQNVLKRTLAMISGTVISLNDLPDHIVMQAGEVSASDGKGFFPLRERHMARFEKDYLSNILTAAQGDVSLASREAQLPRGTFYRLLKKYDLNPADFRRDDAMPRGS
jgi:DNA-binding NtrC family response regulator